MYSGDVLVGLPVVKLNIALPLLISSETEKTLARILCAESGRLGWSNGDSLQWPQAKTQEADLIVKLGCGDRGIIR